MKMIGQRIQDGVYRTLDDIERDFFLMVKNAKTFNEPKSQIYKVKWFSMSCDNIVLRCKGTFQI